MRNFTLVIFSLFVVILLLSFNYTDPIYSFIAIFLAFILSLICLIAYLGFLRGLVVCLSFLILPFVLEYLFKTYNIYKFPFFNTTIFTSFDKAGMATSFNLKNLFTAFMIPTMLASSLIFAQKIKLYSLIRKYFGTFLVLTTSILFALNFLILSPSQFSYTEGVKWLIIGLAINLVLVKLYKFNIKANDIYKELPIILFLLLYGFNLMKTNNTYSILIAVCLGIYYLITLLNEHKLKKLNQ